MRVDQLVSSFISQTQLQGSANKPADLTLDPRLDGAKRANQARVSDTAKGYVQGAKVRDGIKVTAQALTDASTVIDKLRTTSVSSTERTKFQSDFTKALAAVEQGVKDQQVALADKTATNTVYDAQRVKVTTADQLGKGASQTIGSVAELKKLDLSTATAAQLTEASKVLEAAKSQIKIQATVADAQVSRIANRLNTFQVAQNALDGTSSAPASTDPRQQFITQLLQQQQTATSLVPGSLFNSFG